MSDNDNSTPTPPEAMTTDEVLAWLTAYLDRVAVRTARLEEMVEAVTNRIANLEERDLPDDDEPDVDEVASALLSVDRYGRDYDGATSHQDRMTWARSDARVLAREVRRLRAELKREDKVGYAKGIDYARSLLDRHFDSLGVNLKEADRASPPDMEEWHGVLSNLSDGWHGVRSDLSDDDSDRSD